MKIAICDDEKTARDASVSMVEDYMQERRTELEYTVFERYPDLEPRIDEFDVFIMDYQTPEIDGISFAKKIREKYGENKAIIFVTSFSDIVYDAFEVRAYRFLVKPIDKFKFFEAMDSFLKTNKTTNHLVIKNDGQTDVIDTDDILYIEVAGKELYIYTDEDQFVCRRSIASVEDELTPFGFYRVHRTYLVNMKNIASFKNDTVELKNGESIAMSPRKYKDFSKDYLKFINK